MREREEGWGKMVKIEEIEKTKRILRMEGETEVIAREKGEREKNGMRIVKTRTVEKKKCLRKIKVLCI